MRKYLWLLPAIGCAAAAGLIWLNPLGGAAPEAKAAAKASPALPITRVVLFSSGVGYFQREGNVDGDARVDLTFPEADVNDLLKSMVLQDMGGGQIGAVSYDSHDPVERTLQSFAINLNGSPTVAQVLTQARGEKVEVTLQQGAAAQPGNLTGSILGIEHAKAPSKDGAADVEQLNLWCAEGLRSVKLADVQRLRFLNPVMESELRRALETLALSHDAQKKAVSLSFKGEGERKVRVGYVVESPVWKTSYRLVLDKDGKQKPFLQGWAVVENPTDEDWAGVGMALISGRPISFKMDLYQPLYVNRPVVEPELFASLRPPTYNGAMAKMDNNGNIMTSGEFWFMRQTRPTVAKGRKTPEDHPHEVVLNDAETPGPVVTKQLAERMDLSGVQNMATASQLGDYFQYLIDQPVNLARQKSALLPIVNKDVEGTKVSIYNQAVQAKHPLLGLKFKNTSGLHLMQGPITVFEGSTYAGDTRALDLQPNEERLLSYAVDLGTEVNPTVGPGSSRLTKIRLNKGIVFTTTKVREEKAYQVANRSQQDRLLVLEHPYRPEFAIVSDTKPKEQARDVYRFEIPVAAGKSLTHTVAEERDVGSTVQISNTNDDQMRLFINQTVSSQAVKAALGQALEKKAKVDESRRELQQVERKLNEIVQDQTRLRANIKELPQGSAAHAKYLKKFDDQEGEIEDLRAKIKKYQDEEFAHRKTFDDFLAKLDVE
jgi:hypothetical protein